MRILYIIIACMMFIGLGLQAEDLDYQEDLKLYNEQCKRCHEMTYHLWPKSFKAWQLTVENMRTYIYDEEGYTKEEGTRIARFLAEYGGENEILPSKDSFAEIPTPEPEPPVAVTEPDVPVTVASEPEAPVIAAAAQTTRPPLAHPKRERIWNPPRAAMRIARISGFFSVFCLSALVISGFTRKKLKRRFRKLHVSMALGLFVSLSLHGIIYIAKYGTPHVLWYWFGLIGFIALIVTQVQGIVRKRFSKGLLKTHIVGACLGLALSILHWIWAWL